MMVDQVEAVFGIAGMSLAGLVAFLWAERRARRDEAKLEALRVRVDDRRDRRPRR